MHASELATGRLVPAATLYARRAAAAGARATSAVAERPLATLAVLAVAHWLAVLAFALTVRHNGWLFYQGGDQIWLVTTGWLLGQGELAPTFTGYGWPLVLAPITWFTGSSFVSAMPPVIALNVLVLGPLALWAIYGLAARVAGRVFGLIAAATWVVLPFAVVPLWRDDYHERYVEQFLPQALGLSALADYQSMVLLLVGAFLFVRALETRAALDAVAAGLVVGFAVGMKPSNGLFVAAPLVAAALARNLRPVLPFALAILPALLTLALWKKGGLGTVPAFAPAPAAPGSETFELPLVGRYIDLNWAVLHDNANHLREYFWSARLLEWLPIAGALGVARRSVPLAGLLATWFAAFLVVKGTTPLSTVASGSFFRFMLPAFPAYFLLAVSTLLLVPTVGRRLGLAWPERRATPVGRRLAGGLALVLAVLPLVVFAVVRPIDSPDDAVIVNGILTPVDSDIEVSTRREDAARVITWTHQSAGSTDVFYRVYRSAAGATDIECLTGDGAWQCYLEGELLGTTRQPRWRDESSPAGSIYRIGVAANWANDPTAGDDATLSPPLRSD